MVNTAFALSISKDKVSDGKNFGTVGYVRIGVPEKFILVADGLDEYLLFTALTPGLWEHNCSSCFFLCLFAALLILLNVT